MWGLRTQVVFSGAFTGRVFSQKGVRGDPFERIKGYEGHPPELKIKVVMSKVVFKGLPKKLEYVSKIKKRARNHKLMCAFSVA